MAIHNLGLNEIKIEDSWEGKSGIVIEDVITRNITENYNNTIESISYEGQTLYLHKKDNTSISTIVTPVTPRYEFKTKIFGIKIDNTVYKEGSHFTLSNTSNVSLLVGTYGLVYTIGDPLNRGGGIKGIIVYESENNKSSLEVDINLLDYNAFLFDSENNIVGIDEENYRYQEIPISKLLTKYQKNGKIQIKLLEGDTNVYDELFCTITCETPNLKFNSNLYYTNNQSISFSLSEGTSGSYHLTGFLNGKDLDQTNVDKLNYNLLKPGLNLFVIRATHNDYANINSNWVTVDLICTNNCEETVIAVNEVSNGIINNGIATLYNLTVFSFEEEELNLTTYLEEQSNPELGSEDHLIKTETITKSNYKDNIYTTSYKKYIEEEVSGNKYLMIEANNNYYTFYTPNILNKLNTSNYKIMNVEEPNINFIYYKDVLPNYCFDQITGLANNVFVKNNINPKLETTDGWGEVDGICYYKVSALSEPVFKEKLDLNLQKSLGFTIELGFNTYNISNKSKPIMTIGKLLLWPTQLVWDNGSGESNKVFTERNALFLEGVDTHLMITVHPNYKLDPNDPYYPKFLRGNQNKFDNVVKNFSYNLVRIYINGKIDRVYALEDSDLNDLISNKLQINPTSSDINFYLLRVYNSIALSGDLVEKNYNSFIFDKIQKLKFYDDNNITINGRISFKKAREKYNTIVLVLPNGVTFPNYTWNSEMEDEAKKNPATMFIQYASPELNQKYGGRLNWLLEKGQGSSAKRYLIWNVQSSLNKFKDTNDNKIQSTFISYNSLNFDSDLNKFKQTAEIKLGSYVMPTYQGLVDGSSNVTKSVGKVNWASSMQSHKIGACKLYDDAYKTKYPNSIIGKKAVHEEPFLYFYWETDKQFDKNDPNSGVNNVELYEILENDENVKFAGFLTWGAGKGDEFESGYNKKETPEYLMLEGGENKNVAVNFRVPWHGLLNVDSDKKQTKFPTISKEDSIKDPSSNLYIHDESIAYNSPESSPVGAWDIDFGYDEDTNSFLENVKTSLKRFREFYDFVYLHDFSFIPTNSNKSSELKDISRKYVITNKEFFINEKRVNNHKDGDVYRYDSISKEWVPAGLYYDLLNNQWERFNIYEQYPAAGSYLDTVLDLMKEDFHNGIKEYIDVDDIAFHQAFIKFVSGTDNRAKNTYFQIIGPKYLKIGDDFIKPEITEGNWSDYKIRLIGDDLDTIFVTDNAGLQSKPYNLLEASYDSSMKEHWGDEHNIFFYMFDICFEDEIRENLKVIINKAFNNLSLENKTTYFYQNFFGVQENFPAVAYNHTSRLYYENAYIIYKNGQDGNAIIEGYENNGVNPLGQSHGPCLECEKQFMKERMDFLSGYAQTNLGTQFATIDSTGSSGAKMNLLLTFTPYQDFYPNYGFGASGSALNPHLIEPDEKISDLRAINNLVKKDIEYTRAIKEITPEINQGLYQMSLYKTLDILGLQGSNLPSLQRGVELTVDNNKMEGNPDFNETEDFKLSKFDGSYPVLEVLSLKKVKLPSILDLTNCKKLTTLDLSGSFNVEKVILPETGRLTSIILPSSITSLELYNNPGLSKLEINKLVVIEGENYYEEDLSALLKVYIDGKRCSSLNISALCLKLINCNSLEEVTLKNIDITITEEVLSKLIYLNKCDISGKIKVIDSNGNLKGISFKTKEKLVNIFGNINEKNNNLYVEYLEVNILSIDTAKEIYMYKPKNISGNYEIKSPFNLNISSGNNIVVVNGENPYNNKVNAYLNIKYSIDVDSKIATIDLTGTIVLKNLGTTKEANVTIVVVTTTQTFTKEITVKLLWSAPLIGQFAYADGTFSFGYDSSKTLVGLVYAKKSNSENEGTVYIIGKEYATTTELYLGLGEGLLSELSKQLVDFYRILNAEFTKSIIGEEYDYIQGILGITEDFNSNSNSSIIYNNYNLNNTYFKGKDYTLKYVKHVNNMLEKLYKIGSPFNLYINYSGLEYYIDSINNLNKLANALSEDNRIMELGLNDKNIIKSILFPYFYSMYLYEPSVKSGETLHDLYKSTNWYAPSTSELGRIIYYRGYSASGKNFLTGTEINNPISVSIETGTTDKEIPIFSIAQTNGYIATCWNNIASNDKNNITTNTISTYSPENYAYKYYQSYINNEYVNIPGWVIGTHDYSSIWNSNKSTNVWRGITHFGVPFTQYNYKNDSV